ncbi:MAG: hypothetical protein KDB35_12970 [Acidimicrobiales bacterium]|nr:hypothetical protein [Acidimicrobiales bacterium]MCB1013661.1 hypothetical protein [Acidimicrobiales bacterium]
MSPRSLDSHDEVLARRARIKRAVDVGQRVGYGLFGVAVVGFFVGLVVDFTDPLVTVIVAALVVGSVVLAPAIVFGYGVKAAERDDAEHGRPTQRGTP